MKNSEVKYNQIEFQPLIAIMFSISFFNEPNKLQNLIQTVEQKNYYLPKQTKYFVLTAHVLTPEKLLLKKLFIRILNKKYNKMYTCIDN